MEHGDREKGAMGAEMERLWWEGGGCAMCVVEERLVECVCMSTMGRCVGGHFVWMRGRARLRCWGLAASSMDGDAVVMRSACAGIERMYA